jgi:hypothetical protein
MKLERREETPRLQREPQQHTAWEAYRAWTGINDYDLYRQAFIGAWSSRDAFGEHLLKEFGAAERLAALPQWLQHYVTLVPERIVADFETAGYYHVASVREGVFVFDAQVVYSGGLRR